MEVKMYNHTATVESPRHFAPANTPAHPVKRGAIPFRCYECGYLIPSVPGQDAVHEATGATCEHCRKPVNEGQFRTTHEACKGVAPVVAMQSVQPELPHGRGGAPKPVNPGLREAIEFLAAYEGTWAFMLTLKAEQERGQLKYTDRVIEVILNCKRRDDARPKPVEPRPAAAEPKDGWFEVNGEVVKVQIAVHGSGKPYAKRLVIEGGRGRWEYAPGLIRECTPERRLSPERAMEMGKLYGVCVVCGAVLTDEKSIDRGIGPICFGKLAAERGFGADEDDASATDDFNERWAEHKNEYARREIAQDRAAYEANPYDL